ncbi:hypothetical protein [Flavobacterium sp. ASW18X]|uniref:hypothetical protein n=1 Tax=Flavobacterium sp. ASW18X TaxID=2572595 RepID=UPI0010AE3F37|nr:hypothetical protein [Flavobacterium sp. ASW18X]TKD67231.1 hypothetical protein FBT53_00030 [Flavobacterium sp. ASW18X]
MKFSLLFIITVFTASAVYGQEVQVIGEYEKNVETNDGSILVWTVHLKEDSTFLYNFYRKLNCDACKEENFWGKGKWTAKENVITIQSEKEKDLDSIYTMDFSITKARIKSQSKRNLSAKRIPNKLIFYDSPLSLIKGLKLVKKS